MGGYGGGNFGMDGGGAGGFMGGEPDVKSSEKKVIDVLGVSFKLASLIDSSMLFSRTESGRSPVINTGHHQANPEC